MSDLYILGTSGHAFDVADVAAAVGHRPIFVTNQEETLAAWSHTDPIVMETFALATSGRQFAIGVGDNRVRSQIARRLGGVGSFPTLIHPETSFGRGTRELVESSCGTVIFAGARFTNHIVFGNFVTINLGVTISHDVELGDYVNLSPGAHIAGNVQVGEGTWIGIGVAVNQGSASRKRTIGAWTTVGSGAVVISDCAPDSLYVGVPARKIK